MPLKESIMFAYIITSLQKLSFSFSVGGLKKFAFASFIKISVCVCVCVL